MSTDMGNPGLYNRSSPTPIKNLNAAPIAPPIATCIVVISIALQCGAKIQLSTATLRTEFLKVGEPFT